MTINARQIDAWLDAELSCFGFNEAREDAWNSASEATRTAIINAHNDPSLIEQAEVMIAIDDVDPPMLRRILHRLEPVPEFRA